MSDDDAFHTEIKQLIVEALALEDVSASEIDSYAPLFGEGEGLGLDSIDALEIAMVLEEKYGVVLEDDPEMNQAIFSSIKSLAAFVAEKRVG